MSDLLHAAWAALRGASLPMLALATLANLAAIACGAVAWWSLLPIRAGRRLGPAFRATWVGFAASSVLPANSGALLRIALFARESGAGSAAATSALVLQRSVDGAVAALLVLLALPTLGAALPWRPSPWLVGGALAIAVALLAALRAPATLRAWVRRTRLGAWLRDGWEGTRRAATPGRLATAAALSVAAWTLQWGAYHLAARSVGLDVGAATSLALLAATNLSFLVRVTPGNVGVFQVAFVATAALLRLPAAPATAAAVLLQALQTVPVLVIAGVVLGVRLPHRWRPEGTR